MRSLPPAESLTAPVRGRRTRKRPGLSRRQTKRITRVGQQWEHVDSGELWRVKQLHRADTERNGRPIPAYTAPVVLERPGDGLRFLTFGELGSQYRLAEESHG